MTRVAAIDCGTNSIRLLVADVEPGRDSLRDVVRRMEIVRLGQDVDRTGRLAPAALDRTFAALRDYAGEIERHGAERVRMCATSATRDAANRDEFVQGVVAIFGTEPEVVSGGEEAELSFTGATRGMGGELEAPYLVVDIGGGSTEFVLGAEAVIAARSVDIGCVRLTERRLPTDPPTPAEVAAAVADIDAGIAHAAEVVPVQQARTLIGLAGSVTTVAGIALDLPAYDPAKIHRARLTAGEVGAVTERLLTMPSAQRAALPTMHPGRVDVIGAGALILRRIVEVGGFPAVVVSEHDILDGIAWSAAERS